MKKTFQDITHYLSLIGILIASAMAFFLYPFDRALHVSVAIAAAAAYVSWGVIHHKIHDDFELSVLVEYLVLAILGLVIVFSLVIRA